MSSTFPISEKAPLFIKWSELGTQQFALEKPATGWNLDHLMLLPPKPYPWKDVGPTNKAQDYLPTKYAHGLILSVSAVWGRVNLTKHSVTKKALQSHPLFYDKKNGISISTITEVSNGLKKIKYNKTHKMMWYLHRVYVKKAPWKNFLPRRTFDDAKPWLLFPMFLVKNRLGNWGKPQDLT